MPLPSRSQLISPASSATKSPGILYKKLLPVGGDAYVLASASRNLAGD
jgi:hypothetical protein